MEATIKKTPIRIETGVSPSDYRTPMKVVYRINDSADSPFMEGICPRCHSQEGLYDGQPFCSECGQAIDWNR